MKRSMVGWRAEGSVRGDSSTGCDGQPTRTTGKPELAKRYLTIPFISQFPPESRRVLSNTLEAFIHSKPLAFLRERRRKM